MEKRAQEEKVKEEAVEQEEAEEEEEEKEEGIDTTPHLVISKKQNKRQWVDLRDTAKLQVPAKQLTSAVVCHVPVMKDTAPIEHLHVITSAQSSR